MIGYYQILYNSHYFLCLSSFTTLSILTHSSHLNFSTPNKQRQFNRSDMLCGQGLSAMFGSSDYLHCSNICLLLIVPFEIAGLVLLCIFNSQPHSNWWNYQCIHIISIDTPVFFSYLIKFTPAYTLFPFLYFLGYWSMFPVLHVSAMVQCFYK